MIDLLPFGLASVSFFHKVVPSVRYGVFCFCKAVGFTSLYGNVS